MDSGEVARETKSQKSAIHIETKRKSLWTREGGAREAKTQTSVIHIKTERKSIWSREGCVKQKTRNL